VIDPDGGQVIDREAEAELFRELLRFADQRRLFLISDRKQRGKTTLLRKLKYQCDWNVPRIPCALVRLDDLEDSHPYALVEAIYEELQLAGVSCPGFQQHRDAIRRRDASPFAAQGSASFAGAFISGGQAAGTIVNVQGGVGTVVVNPATVSWDPGLESYAREAAIREFFRELSELCRTETVVCLMDTVDEQANRTLVTWVLEKFVRAQLLDSADPPDRLLLALAGRSEQSLFPPYRKNYPQRVHSLEGLGAWSNEHVRAFLELNRPAGATQWPPTDVEIEFLRTRINSGDTLYRALSVIMVLYAAEP
jgi:hypothetical protein